MKLLHTSDWHLGRNLYGRSRKHEFESFLNWLLTTLQEQHIDILLVAGDIFDTTTPSNLSQELYYNFLHQVQQTGCRHVVIVGGNHDSPSFLNAPSSLLRFHNIHVFGAQAANLEDALLELKNPAGEVEALICAVPYLRDQDLRQVISGESLSEKSTKVIEAIQVYYAQLVELAVAKQQELLHQQTSAPPIIASGHLFTTGALTYQDDGVREIYVGGLDHLGQDAFPKQLDYLALGHLHVPQKVGGQNHLRYSGSPLPIGFGEAAQQKVVLVAEFSNQLESVTEIPVPSWQPLQQISGSLAELKQQLKNLAAHNTSIWLEVELTSQELIPNLSEEIEAAIAGSQIEVLRLKNRALSTAALNSLQPQESLEELSELEVFQRRLELEHLAPEVQQQLTAHFQQLLQDLNEQDSRKE